MVQPDGWLVVASARGFAKRVPLKEFTTKGRYTGGMTAFTVDSKTGELAAARITSVEEDVTFIAASGLNVRVRAENLAKGNRGAKGKMFVTLKDTDSIARLTSLTGQIAGEALKETPEEKKPESKKPEPVVVSSNGHGAENGSEKKAKPKEEPKETKTKQATAKKLDAKKSAPAKASKAEPKKAKAAPKKAAPAKGSESRQVKRRSAQE